MLELNTGLIIWTALTFGVLLVVLRSYAWKPILNNLETREESIRQSLERAEEAKREAERILEENKKNLAKAEEMAQQVLREARELGEKIRSELASKARAEGDKLLERARDEIERDKQLAMTQLHGLVAELAVKAAEKILDETIDEVKQKKLVENFINSLGKN
ncbi:MAG TPA: F0F1 ATP synthase subunit B [Candidatus Acidoferrales bacterium]|nr:F0F1 ATP synthase subunit B [Candidatus Acidoferrales bacterium]